MGDSSGAIDLKQGKISDRYLHSYITQSFFNKDITNHLENSKVCMFDNLNMNANDNDTIIKYADILEKKILPLYERKIDNHYTDINTATTAITSKYTNQS